jgi:hypothetical protein
MTYSNYPHGFTNGVTIRNIPINIDLNPKANVFWVDSVNGKDTNKGNVTYPFNTLKYALTKCKDDHGDIIYLAVNHTEDIPSAGFININVSGVTIVFMANGYNNASLSFSTATTASLIISGDNVTLVNPTMINLIDALAAPISITGEFCSIIDGSWYDFDALAATNCIVASATASYLVVDGWTYYAGTTGTQKVSHISLNGCNRTILKRIDIRGDFSAANINNVTAAITNASLSDIYLKNTNVTPKPGIVLQATASGVAKNIDIRIDSGTTYLSSVAKFNFDSRCLGYHADGAYGTQIGTTPV